MLHGRYENGIRLICIDTPDAARIDSRIRNEKDNHGQNHEIGVEQQQDACMIEAPSAMQAARCLAHSPQGDHKRKDLPGGTMKSFDMGKAGQQQAAAKSSERQKDAAREGFLPQAEDGEEGKHRT